MSRLAFVLLFTLAVSAGAAGDKWQLKYFYDEDESALTITDLKFPSPERGIAVGYLTKNGGRPSPAQVTTGDGGATWTLGRAPDVALSLFFLNENAGWLVGQRDLWRTSDAGKKWQKVKAPDALRRVHFMDDLHGFAAGAEKGFYETTDGGKSWTRVAAVDEVKSSRERTVFDAISFGDSRSGLVAGWSRASDGRPRVPEWMDPEGAQLRRNREVPGLTIFLQTRDGGKRWTPSSMSMFGIITRISLAGDGRGLGLVEFVRLFDWPSEVMRINWRTGDNARAFRERNRSIKDVAVTSGGPAYLAAIEPQGQLLNGPIPGKLKMLRSNDLETWQEMEVDYRAFGSRAVLAVRDGGDAWVATDSGHILKLVQE